MPPTVDGVALLVTLLQRSATALQHQKFWAPTLHNNLAALCIGAATTTQLACMGGQAPLPCIEGQLSCLANSAPMHG